MAKHKFAINDQEFDVEVGARHGSRVQVSVNGKDYDVELKSLGVAPKRPPISKASPSIRPPAPSVAPAASAANEVRAPMAGLVLGIRVKVGDQVAVGDELLSLEAMKMENSITAERVGTVKRIAVEPQQVVNQGDVLVELS